MNPGASDGGVGLFTRNRLQGMVKGKDYWVLVKVFLRIGASIDQGSRHRRTASLTNGNTYHSGIVCDVTGWQ